MPGYSSDPFFFEPYEEKPKEQTATDAETQDRAASNNSVATLPGSRRNGPRTRQRGQVPALLGGLKKSG
jgi:hypothetical protein